MAGETAGELVDPTLTRAWLYALTRNECLRAAARRSAGWTRRPGRRPPSWPAGTGWPPAEVAAVLGGPAPARGRARARRSRSLRRPGGCAPSWSRPSGSRRPAAAPSWPAAPTPTTPRASRSRSAPAGSAPARSPGPRRPRCSVALAMLVTLPPGGADQRAARAPPLRRARSGRARSPHTGGAAHARPRRGSRRPPPRLGRRPARTAGGPPAGRRPAGSPVRAERAGIAGGSVRGPAAHRPAGERRPGPDCGATWAADLRVRAYGQEQAAVARVTAGADGAGTVALAAGRRGSWRVRAGGPADRRRRRSSVRAARRRSSTTAARSPPAASARRPAPAAAPGPGSGPAASATSPKRPSSARHCSYAARISARLAGHEVPPHQHRLAERLAAEQQHPGVRASAVSASSSPAAAEVGEPALGDRLAVDRDRAGQRHQPVLEVRPQRPRSRCPGAAPASAPTSGVSCRVGAVTPASVPASTVSSDWSSSTPGSSAWCGEGRLAEPGGVRLGHPQLHPLQRAAEAAGRLLRVGHAPAGGHQVELAGRDQLLRCRGCPGAAPGRRRAR